MARTESGLDPKFLPAQRMGKLGAELVMKATVCAGMIALAAGMLAALIGS